MRSAVGAVVVAVVVIALGSCGGKRAQTPRVAAPALLASIPADTPYVVASFDAIPLEVLAMYRDSVGSALRSALENPMGEGKGDDEGEGGASGDDTYDRLVAALFNELDGKWNAAGMESLGLSATPRFAIYGLGLYPVVRLEIRDGAKLLATVQRVSQRAGLSLPQPEAREGRRFWRIVEGKHAFVIAIAPDQLVFAYVPSPRLEAELPLVLGLRRPERSMAGGEVLASVRERHRLGGHAVGYIDTRRLAGAIQGLSNTAPSAACSAELDRVAARAPRIVGGYQIGPHLHESAFVLELAADLAADVRSLRTELPAVAGTAGEQPLFLMAAGVDLPRAQALGAAGARAIGRAAAACGRESAGSFTEEMAGFLTRPLPPPFGDLRGGLIAIRAMTLAEGPIPLPTELDGFVLASTPTAPALFEHMRAAVSALLPLDFGADGKLHELPQDRLPLQLPFELYAGAGPRAVVIGAGSSSRPRAARAMAAPPAPAPLAFGDFDYGRLMELRARSARGANRELDAATATLYGRATMQLDVTDRGLELRGGFEMKPQR